MVGNQATLEREIEQLERDFWQATAGDGDRLAELTAPEFTFVMAEGINRFARDEFVEMMTQGDYKLTSFAIDGSTVVVHELGPAAAAIAYRAKSQFTLEGHARDNDANYSSVWVKEGSRWACAAAFEAVAAVQDMGSRS